jgi:protein-tyrosine phosphatase
MLDLHCHLLPGVDDGPPSVSVALEMARQLVSAGFERVAASPHLGAGPGGDITPARAAQVREALSAELERAGIELTVLPNAEHHISPELFDRIGGDAIIPIGGDARWLLVELPWAEILHPEAVFFRLQAKGFRLLLAHPERHDYLEVETIETFVERGIKLQIELGSFVDVHGRRARARAEELVERSLVHVLATDLHRPQEAAWLPEALRSVDSRYGGEALALGTRANPQRMLEDATAGDIVPIGGAE